MRKAIESMLVEFVALIAAGKFSLDRGQESWLKIGSHTRAPNPTSTLHNKLCSKDEGTAKSSG